MSKERTISKRLMNKAGNVLFIGLLLVFVFSTSAKSWVLQQLVSVGLFNQGIKKEASAKNIQKDHLSFAFIDANGQTTTLDALKGKIVFINFWASWCPPCLAEMPSLNNLYNALKNDERFVFLFISEDENFAKAEAYLQKKNYNLPLAKRSSTVAPQLFSGTLPTTLVLDKEGNIVFKHKGIGGYHSDKFLRQLKKLAE